MPMSNEQEALGAVDLREPRGLFQDTVRRLAEAAMSVTHHDAAEHEPGYIYEVRLMERRFTNILRGKIKTVGKNTTPPTPSASEAVADLREKLVSYVVHYGSRCRECADEDGVCPSTGIGCGDRRKAGEFVVNALIYGATHGYCPAILATPPASDKAPSAAETSPAQLQAMQLLADIELHLQSVRIFLTSREKMHPCGVEIHDELQRKVTAAIEEMARV